MSFLSSSYTGPQLVSYLFIDGAYLRNVIERLHTEVFTNARPQLAHRQITGSHTKVFYYDCPPAKRQLETDEQHKARVDEQASLYDKLRELRGWHVYEGVVKRTGKQAKQKEVDILIAVDMLTHAHRRNMNTVSFLAGDQDFRPLIDALVRDGMFVELIYDPASISKELAEAADSRVPLTPYALFNWLEPEFQAANPLPERQSSSKRRAPESSIEVADVPHGRAEILVMDGRYLLIRPNPENPRMYLHMTHSNCELLKAVHAKTYGHCQWRPSDA
jgi:uncharacterized LabA/DUF88 family protein